MKRSLAITLAGLLIGCGAVPEQKPRPACYGTVTHVTEQRQRGGSTWYVGIRDARGMTHVCRGGEKAQALQRGDHVDGRDLWN